MDNHWPDLYADKFAELRLKKSCELLDARPGQSILDVGCNTREAKKYLPAECEYVGIDGIYGDSIDGGFKHYRTFDRILCLEVLEHLQFPRGTLKSIAEHLAPNGIAVISLPNEATLFHRARSLFGIVDQECFSENGKHLHLPSLSQCRAFLRERLEVYREEFYISAGTGVRQRYIEILVKKLSPKILQFAANLFPSLFSRGFIFVCRKSPTNGPS